MATSIPQPNHSHNLISHRIDNGRLEFVSVLGLGAYGVVYLARDVTVDSPPLTPSGEHGHCRSPSPDGRPAFYAVKCLNKVGLDGRQRSFQRREIALHMLASSHPNVVTLHNVIETSTCIYVVLAYCTDGDLFGMITERSRYLGDDELVRAVFLQVIDAVEYCHRLGIYHRDLKPENILCSDDGQTVVLADFGLATAERTSGDFGCGSTFYMSPECQGGLFQRLGSYSTMHNDIWSLGVILVNLTCGRNPWKQACPDDETFRAYLANPDFLRSILPVSTQCNDLLKRIFHLNPHARIGLAELRDEVLRVKRWTMTEAELRTATRAAREAARAPISHIVDAPTTNGQGHGHHALAATGATDWGSDSNASTAFLYQSHLTWDEQSYSSISTVPRPVMPMPPHTPRPTPSSVAQAPQHRPPPLMLSPVDEAAAAGVPTPPTTPRRRPTHMSGRTSPCPLPPPSTLGSAFTATSPPSSGRGGSRAHLSAVAPHTPTTPRLSRPQLQPAPPSPPTDGDSSSGCRSGGSSSSGGSVSWTALPPTPSTPTFGAQQRSGAPRPTCTILDADAADDDDVSSMWTQPWDLSDASHKHAYPLYARWAASSAAADGLAVHDDDDVDAMDVCEPAYLYHSSRAAAYDASPVGAHRCRTDSSPVLVAC